MSDELENLVNIGAAIDASDTNNGLEDSLGGVAIAPPDPDAAAMQWLFLPEILSLVATQIYPETSRFYTDASNLEFARRFAAVAEKYGWQGTEYGPEVGLVMGGIAFAMPVWMAHKQRQAAAVAARQQVAGGGDGDAP